MGDGINEGWKKYEEQLPDTYINPVHFPIGTTIDGVELGNSPIFNVVDKRKDPPLLGPGDAGTKYIIADSATGDWAGHDKDIAIWNGTAWEFIETDVGWLAYTISTAQGFSTLYVRHIDLSVDEWRQLSKTFKPEIVGFENQSMFYFVSSGKGSDSEGDGTIFNPYETVEKVLEVDEDYPTIIVDDTFFGPNVSIPAGRICAIVSLDGNFNPYIDVLSLGIGSYVYGYGITILDVQETGLFGPSDSADLLLFANSVLIDGTKATHIDLELRFALTLLPASAEILFKSVKGTADDNYHMVTWDGLDLKNNNAINMATPVDDQDGATKKFVDDGDALLIPKVVFPTPGNAVEVTAQGTLIDAGVSMDTLKAGLTYKGTWNATTNTPTLGDNGAGGVQGDMHKVSVAGSTSIDGHSDWEIGDMLLHNGTTWDKFDNTEPSVTAALVAVSTTNFDRLLTSSENTSQKVFDKVDEYAFLVKSIVGTLADKIHERYGILDYTNGGLTVTWNNELTGTVKEDMFSVQVSVELKNLTYSEQLLIVPIWISNWVSDHWETVIHVNKIYDDGAGGLSTEECATNDVTVHVRAIVDEDKVI